MQKQDDESLDKVLPEPARLCAIVNEYISREVTCAFWRNKERNLEMWTAGKGVVKYLNHIF